MANKLTIDELPKKLIKNGEKIADILMIYGFVAASTDEESITFYFDPLLKNSINIHEKDIVHHVKMTKTHSLFGGTILWIKNASSYLNTYDTRNQQEAAQFFQGDIYQQFINTTQNNTLQQQQKKGNAPVCGCGKCR